MRHDPRMALLHAYLTFMIRTAGRTGRDGPGRQLVRVSPLSHRRVWAFGVCVALATLEVPLSASAQELVPPKLVSSPPATYPDGYEEAGLAGSVDMQLTIDRDGRVTEAEVLGSAGEALDKAAVEATRQFEFSPATRDGEPIPATIRYRYVFRPRQSKVTPPPEPEGGVTEIKKRSVAILAGVVRSMEDKPVVGARVIAVPQEAGDQQAPRQDKPADGGSADDGAISTAGAGTAATAVTAADGSFEIDLNSPGDYRVSLSAEGYQNLILREQVGKNQKVQVVYRLSEGRTEEVGFGAVATVDPPAREVVKRTVTQEEFVRIPGTRGDALRVVELLPGVGRPPFSVGLLIVRGSAPEDSESFLEGSPIPLVYHFGGFTSVFNSRLLERFDFYPGNFGVRYGRRVGGILDVSIKDTPPPDLGGYVDINLIDASFLVEAPIGEDFNIALAARRSYVDALFEAVVPSEVGVVAAPVYWDYQAVATYRPSAKDTVQAIAYGSSDRLRLLFEDPSSSDPAFRDNFSLNTQFHRFDLRWKRKLSPKVDQEISATVGPDLLSFDAGPDISFDLDVIQAYSRAEWIARVHPKLKITGGWDVSVAPYDIVYRGPEPEQGEGNPGGGPVSTQDIGDARVSDVALRPAMYLEADYRPVDPLSLVVGVRTDYFSTIDEWSVDPRLSSTYAITDQTRLKAGVGLFSQPPEFQESVRDDFGNPNLKPIKAIHTGLGFEHDIFDGLTVGAEGFFKYLYDRVVGTPDGRDPNFINDGLGRIYGLELSGRIKPGGKLKRWIAFASYTLSRSERNDRGEGWRLFDFDQTHILNLATVYKIGGGWEIGGRFSLVSGNPETGVVGSVYDVNADLFIPLNGAINNQRNPYFHRLDIRVEKKWTFSQWALAAYLDVQNVYNQRNREATSYNFNYTESGDVPGLPIIPSLGVRGEF